MSNLIPIAAKGSFSCKVKVKVCIPFLGFIDPLPSTKPHWMSVEGTVSIPRYVPQRNWSRYALKDIQIQLHHQEVNDLRLVVKSLR